ncbi:MULTISPECIES: hypothetical protein [unclassified Isoptericola]|uniref:hypothetical protein n=1 Tax=unclassified Isoptericola TaxID=2623355 RepID=UPI003650CBFF
MAVTVPDLIERVGGDPTADEDEATRCLTLADRYVTDYVGAEVVPTEAVDEAVLRVGVNLFNQAKAPNGVLTTVYHDTGDGSETALRVSSDPLRGARVVLSPYLAPLGFA